MYKSDINKLSLGRADFSDIRNSGKIYVDKTSLIAKMAEYDAPIFFSRPRRFGKSLLVNTLHNLFENGLNDFHGLSLEKTWDDSTYKVVHIDFSYYADSESRELSDSLSRTLIRSFDKNSNDAIFYASKSILPPNEVLQIICETLKNRSVVLLIDEYDSPLTHHIDDPYELKRITSILNNFYSVIKSYTSKFRFIFITGVTRVSHLSIFSAFNNLVDKSFDDDFNTLLGFTDTDIRKSFDDYVENAANILHLSKKYTYERIKQYYDGFSFTLNGEETLYNPWSILNFFYYPNMGFKNYWFRSGGTSSIIMQYLKISDSFDFFNYDDRNILIDEDELTNNYEITNIPRSILLLQAGYFTLRNEHDGTVRLILPNGEVEECLFRLYLKSNNLDPHFELRQKLRILENNIDNRNLKTIVNIFNDILNECVSILSNIFTDERSIRDVIYAALIKIPSLQKVKERETLKGRSDLELITKKTHMVIEFKRTNAFRNAENSLKDAIEQLKEKKYGIEFFENHHLYRVAMVVSTEKKAILLDFCKEI